MGYAEPQLAAAIPREHSILLQLEDTPLGVFKHIQILTLPAVQAGTKLSGQGKARLWLGISISPAAAASPGTRYPLPSPRPGGQRSTGSAGPARREGAEPAAEVCWGGAGSRSALLEPAGPGDAGRGQRRFPAPCGEGAAGPRPPGTEGAGRAAEPRVTAATPRRLSPNFGRYNDGPGPRHPPAGRAGPRSPMVETTVPTK